MADTITSWDDLKTIGSKNNWDNAENVYNLIKGTLTGRTAGTPITPASHENMALAVIYNTYMKKAVIDGDLNMPGTVTATGFRLYGGTSDQLLTGNGLYTSLKTITDAIAKAQETANGKSDYTAPTLWGHKLTSGETNYEGDLTSATGYISAAGFKVTGANDDVLLANGNTITQSSLKATDSKDGITSASIWGNAISTADTTVDYNDTAYIDNIESTAKSLILNTGTYPVTIGAGAALVGIGANMFNIGDNYKIGTVGNSVLIGNSYITGTVTALNDITASKFITKDGTSSQLVRGDGTLVSISEIGGSGGSGFSPATIWGQTLVSDGTVKGDLAYVGDIYFDNKYNDTTYYIKETTGVINTNGSLSIDGNMYLSDVNGSGNAYIDGITYHTAPVYFGDSGNSNIHYLNRISDNTGIRTNGDFKADGNIYANKFITDASASDKLVCGDGTLVDKSSAGNNFNATIWGQNLKSGDTVKGDLAYVDNIYFGDKTSTDITYFTTGTHAVVLKGNFSTSGDIIVGLDTDDAGKSINSGALFAYEIYADGILHTSNKLTVKGNSYIEDTAYFTGNTTYFNNSYINNTAYFKNNSGRQASYITGNDSGGIFAYGSLLTPELHTSEIFAGTSYTDNIYKLDPGSTYLAIHNGIYAAGNIYAKKFVNNDYNSSAYLLCGDGSVTSKDEFKNIISGTTVTNAQTADALTTEHKLWGQPFKGDNDVNGQITFENGSYIKEGIDGLTMTALYTAGTISTTADIHGGSAYFGDSTYYITQNITSAKDQFLGLYTNGGLRVNGSLNAVDDIYTAVGNIHTTNGHIYTMGGAITANGGSITANDGDLVSTRGNIYTTGNDTGYISSNTAYIHKAIYTGNAYFTYNDGTTAYKYYISPDKNGLSTNGNLTLTESNKLISITGDYSGINITGETSSIRTTGEYSSIYTTGNNSDIYTRGDAYGNIYTASMYGSIYTAGTHGCMATNTAYAYNTAYFGTNAYCITENANKDGLYTNGYMNIGKTLVINEQLRFNGCNSYIKSMGDGDSINLSGNFIAENLAVTKNAYLFGYTYFDENGKYYISESSDNTGLAINGKHILTETDINGWESKIVVTNQSTGLTSETLGTDVNNNMDGVKITYTRNKYGICNIMFNINLSTKFPSFITEGNAVTSEATLIKTACIKNIPGNSTFGGDFIGNSYDFNITGYAIESDINSSENITPVMCEVKFHNDALWISIIKPYASWTIGNTSDKLLFSGSLMIKE